MLMWIAIGILATLGLIWVGIQLFNIWYIRTFIKLTMNTNQLDALERDLQRDFSDLPNGQRIIQRVMVLVQKNLGNSPGHKFPPNSPQNNTDTTNT
jgi:hypothetical protein